MHRHLLLLFAVALLCTAPVRAEHSTLIAVEFPGGPPAIRVADKARGNITRTEWNAATAVKLAGCVPDARVTAMTVCINDCKGKQAKLTAASGTFSKEMKTMIANLPDGTAFTVKVEVKDASGKSWTVPDAAFTLVR